MKQVRDEVTGGTRDRSIRFGVLRSALLVGMLAAATAGLHGQEVPAAAPAVAERPSTATSAAHPLLRSVTFIGASATGGFGVVLPDPDKKERAVTLPLAASFAGAVTEIATDAGPEVVASAEAAGGGLRNFGSGLFFLSPVVTGSAQVDRALERKPTLVVAVDFLFWYGYGSDNGKGGRVESEADRLAKLELGFRQLERFGPDVPIVVGDFPNMERAVGKMISRDQMPAQETLTRLNERFHAWAKERANVIVFPLASLVESLKGDQPVEIAGLRFDKTQGRLIQSDDLHPTARGSIALGFRIGEAINAWMQSTPAEEKPFTLAADELSATRRAHAAAQMLLARRAGTLPSGPRETPATRAPEGSGTTPGSR